MRNADWHRNRESPEKYALQIENEMARVGRVCGGVRGVCVCVCVSGVDTTPFTTPAPLSSATRLFCGYALGLSQATRPAQTIHRTTKKKKLNQTSERFRKDKTISTRSYPLVIG